MKTRFEYITVVYGGPEGVKSPTWVKCSVRKKSNIEVPMSKYGFLGSYWTVLIRPQEIFRN
jgi:hypothetical protein